MYMCLRCYAQVTSYRLDPNDMYYSRILQCALLYYLFGVKHRLTLMH